MPAIPERLPLFKHSGIFYPLYIGGKRRWKSTGVSIKAEALEKLTEFRELLSKRAQHVSLDKFTQDFLGYAEANHRPRTVAIVPLHVGTLPARHRRHYSARSDGRAFRQVQIQTAHLGD
jgi:hypothetical protein